MNAYPEGRTTLARCDCGRRWSLWHVVGIGCGLGLFECPRCRIVITAADKLGGGT